MARLILVLTGLVIGLLIAGLPTVATISVIGGLFVFYLAFFHPLLLIGILLCIAPFNLLWMGVGVTLPELVYSAAFALLGVSWVLRRLLGGVFGAKVERLSSPVSVPLAAFFSVSVLACAIGVLRGHKLPHWASDLNAIMYYGLCFIIRDVVRDKRQLYRLFLIILISTILALLRGLVYLIMSNPDINMGLEIIYHGLARLRGASVFSLVMFVLSVAMADTLPKGKERIFLVIISIFFGMMLVTSFVRSSWIAAIFGLAFLFSVSLGRQKTNFLKLLLAGILFLSLYLLIAFSLPAAHPLHKSIYAIEKRYESIFTAGEEPSIMTRGSEWTEAMRRALDHPLLGNGLGTEITYFRYDYWLGTQTWNTTRYVHNVYLLLFLNMGIVGLISFLWFCLSFVKYGLSIYRSLEVGMDKALVLGIVSSFASLMVVSLAGPFLASPMLTMWLGFFTGALIIIDKSRQYPGSSIQDPVSRK